LRLSVLCNGDEESKLENSPIVTSSGRGNAKNKGIEVKLAKTGIFPPVDSLELRSLLLSLASLVRVGLPVEDTHG
jgi:hypothetical protein